MLMDQLNDFYIGVKLHPLARENKVRVNSDTKLHITNVLVDLGYFKHKG